MEANQSYLECSSTYIVPKFVGMTLSELATWKSNHSGVSVSTVTIDNSSTVSGVTYDSKYAGKIGAQSASQYTKWDTINNSITVYYFDYPTLTLDVDAISGLSGETAVLNWFSSNWNRTPTISYVYSDTAASGSVISISKTSDGTVYSANIYLNSSTGITVVISKGNTVTVPNLLGQSYSAYSDYMSGLGLSAASAGTTTITDPDTQIAGTIATQSVDAGDGVPFSAARGLTVTVYAE
ncbi:hypothetical protein SDC9_147440 [bioreactor metagenome]|uniref:Uncharacterized protein n=1 Tax=bioreactor metagenome TaxID=1076179 RepID=A0A645EFQ2_9ZZZZ